MLVYKIEAMRYSIIDAFQKQLKRRKRPLALTKRQEFVCATFVLTSGLVLTQLVSIDLRYPLVGVLSLLAFCASAFVLREDLHGVEWVTLLMLPTLFTAAVSLFYFLLPVRWATRLPVALVYCIGMYALLLTENIYNVAAQRGIGLLRAAHSIGFLITLVTDFLLILTIFSFRWPIIGTTILLAAVHGGLLFQSLWAYELGDRVTKRVGEIVIVFFIITFELAFTLGFWPMKPVLTALLLTTTFYSFAGIAQHYLVEKLYKKTMIEFLSVFFIVFLLAIITSRWRG